MVLVCRQDIPLHIQILPKITRPYTVSGENVPFNRPCAYSYMKYTCMCDFHTLRHVRYKNVSPLENAEIGTALIHHVYVKSSWSSLVIIHMCKTVSEYPSHSFTYLPIYFHPLPPMIYIINKLLKYYSINSHF